MARHARQQPVHDRLTRLVENYWKVYYNQEAVIEEIRSAGTERDRLPALLGIADNPSELLPADRDARLIAYVNYRQSLVHLRNGLNSLDRVTYMALANQKIGMDITIKLEKNAP